MKTVSRAPYFMLVFAHRHCRSAERAQHEESCKSRAV
jgi:hypothetical protein